MVTEKNVVLGLDGMWFCLLTMRWNLLSSAFLMADGEYYWFLRKFGTCVPGKRRHVPHKCINPDNLFLTHLVPCRTAVRRCNRTENADVTNSISLWILNRHL